MHVHGTRCSGYALPMLRPSPRRRILVTASALFLTALCLWWFLQTPSNDRNWSADQAVLPYAEINGNMITIQNVRHARYRTMFDYDVHHENRIYDLQKLTSASYVIEPFIGIPGSAHTFLTFEFEDQDPVVISIEVRREKGEIFSAVQGLFRRFELIYVIADERDAIKLRTTYRNHDVLLYPIRTTPAQLQTLFVSMLERANHLHDHPEFYNTLTNSCTTNIVTHINELAQGTVPFSPTILFPDYSDRLAYDLGLIDTDLPFDEARTHFNITRKAQQCTDDATFSKCIRE